MKQNQKALTLKNLNKSNVWDLQENDIIRLWQQAEKDSEMRESLPHYRDIIKTAFEIETITVDNPKVIAKYEERGYRIGRTRIDEENVQKWAIRKHPILRVTDLTYENIHHISAAKLMEVLDRNFGGGWESLSQSIQDIIQSAFDISTTTLPTSRLHKAGGMYEKKMADGFSVLEIVKGTWTEAIFAKEKPAVEMPHYRPETTADPLDQPLDGEDDDDDNSTLPADGSSDFADADDDDAPLTDEAIDEESYRTPIEDAPEDLDIEAEDVADETYGL